MKIAISYPPLSSEKGIPLLAQNRQFQWFQNPTYIYPVVPAQAATLLAQAGYDVLWDDGIAGEQTHADWLSGIVKAAPDVIAIETKTPVIKRHWQIINDLKQWLPRSRVVLMGDHVTAMPEESFRQCEVDYIVTGGDYDFGLRSLMDYLAGRGGLEPGIWFRAEGMGELRNTGPFRLHHSLDELPPIDRDLTRWRLYAEKNGNFKRTPGTYIMAGRDCWHARCTFCSWTTLFPRYRTRSPQHVLDEIGTLIEQYGVREIMDDTGTFPRGDWLREFCHGMIERGYDRRVTLDCNMRFGALSEDDYRLMKRAGFRLLLFGLESANSETLERVSKAVSVEEIVASCRAARRAGLFPHVTIMFGYPWEGYADARRTLELGKWLLKKGWAYTVQATVVIPYPGTPLFDECCRKGWLKTEDWDEYDMKRPVMVTPMTDEQVMGLVQGVYRVVFSPEFLARKVMVIRDLDDMRYFVRAGGKVLGHLLDFRAHWGQGR